jgi:hypothetical protein
MPTHIPPVCTHGCTWHTATKIIKPLLNTSSIPNHFDFGYGYKTAGIGVMIVIAVPGCPRGVGTRKTRQYPLSNGGHVDEEREGRVIGRCFPLTDIYLSKNYYYSCAGLWEAGRNLILEYIDVPSALAPLRYCTSVYEGNRHGNGQVGCVAQSQSGNGNGWAGCFQKIRYIQKFRKNRKKSN